jgi:hypothetical protein
LKSTGVFIFEDPYPGDMLDRIYDEHCFMFCALSVQRAFHDYGMFLGRFRFTTASKAQRSALFNVIWVLSSIPRLAWPSRKGDPQKDRNVSFGPLGPLPK